MSWSAYERQRSTASEIERSDRHEAEQENERGAMHFLVLVTNGGDPDWIAARIVMITFNFYSAAIDMGVRSRTAFATALRSSSGIGIRPRSER